MLKSIIRTEDWGEKCGIWTRLLFC